MHQPFPDQPFPSPTDPASSRAEVFLRYLDFFRSRVAVKIAALPGAELRRSRLPSGWTPLELVKHLSRRAALAGVGFPGPGRGRPVGRFPGRPLGRGAR